METDLINPYMLQQRPETFSNMLSCVSNMHASGLKPRLLLWFATKWRPHPARLSYVGITIHLSPHKVQDTE
jgi:hypothetical protein